MLPGGRRGRHLRGMHGMRRCQHHGIDAGMMEHPVILGREMQALLLGERLDFRRHGAGGAGHEADDVAVLGRLDQRLAPPTESDDARFDHSLSLFGQVVWAKSFGPSHLGHVSMASATQHNAQNRQYSKPPITQIHFRVTL